MKRNILLLLAAPVVGYLAVKLYLHLQVGATVDLLIAQAAPAANVSYGSVTSTIDGRIGVSDVVIRPTSVEDQVSVREISIKLPSLLYALGLEDRVRGQELPESLSVKLHDVAVSTRGKLVRAWEDAIYEDDPDGRLKAFDSCVTRISLPTQMYLLEYDQIRGTFEGGYYFDAVSGNLVLHAGAGQIGGLSADGELALVLNSFDLDSLGRAFTNPEIARGHLHLTDAGYYDRVYAYCEKDGRMSREAVAALLTDDLLAMFDGLPMKPDEPLVNAYREFVSGATDLMITAAPREPKKLEYLSLYDPLDVPAVLNINALVQ